MNIIALIDNAVGLAFAEVLQRHDKTLSVLVYHDSASPAYQAQLRATVKHEACYSYQQLKHLDSIDLPPLDLGLLCWWPTLIKAPLLDLPQRGFINTHPSLLPYGRGKHPYVWSLLDQTPFGVSLHWVDDSTDGGAVAFQNPLPVTWCDTGETLYRRSCEADSAVLPLSLSEDPGASRNHQDRLYRGC